MENFNDMLNCLHLKTTYLVKDSRQYFSDIRSV